MTEHQIDLILNWRDRSNSNVLMWACYYKYAELVNLCLYLGVNKNHKNIYGSTAMDWAKEENDNEEVIKLLRNGPYENYSRNL